MPMVLQNESTPLLRRSNRATVKSYKLGQNDVTAIQKAERKASNEARKSNVYWKKRQKQLAQKLKEVRKKQKEEDAFLEKTMVDKTLQWTDMHRKKLSVKMNQLIELTKKTRPFSDLFFYTAEIKKLMDKHEVKKFDYYGVPNEFLSDLANLVIKQNNYEHHYSCGHTTWDYKCSVVQAVNEFQDFFMERGKMEDLILELHNIFKASGINIEEEFDVEQVDLDTLVKAKLFCTSKVQLFKDKDRRERIREQHQLRKEKRREYMRNYRNRDVVTPAPSPVNMNTHQGGIIDQRFRRSQEGSTQVSEASDTAERDIPNTVAHDDSETETEDEDCLDLRDVDM